MLGRQIPGLEIPWEKKFGIKWNRKAALYYKMTQRTPCQKKKKKSRNNLLKDIIFLAYQDTFLKIFFKKKPSLLKLCHSELVTSGFPHLRFL